MGVFPRFRGWMNLNTQQPLKAESDVKSKPVSQKETNNNAPTKEKVYYNEADEEKQDILWHESGKKHPWNEPPPKVKVTTKNGICHMSIELTAYMTPYGTFEILNNPPTAGFFDTKKWRELLKTKSRKVLMEDGPRQIARLEQDLAWDFLWWSIPIPITMIVDEHKIDLTGKYKKEKMMFMKMFEGSYKVEPIYVDSERLCKQKMPKSPEEYKKCSGGQGKIASKVIMDQYFQPYPPFNLPPLSWFIHGITTKTTETLLKTLQKTAKRFREAERVDM